MSCHNSYSYFIANIRTFVIIVVVAVFVLLKFYLILLSVGCIVYLLSNINNICDGPMITRARERPVNIMLN